MTRPHTAPFVKSQGMQLNLPDMHIHERIQATSCVACMPTRFIGVSGSACNQRMPDRKLVNSTLAKCCGTKTKMFAAGSNSRMTGLVLLVPSIRVIPESDSEQPASEPLCSEALASASRPFSSCRPLTVTFLDCYTSQKKCSAQMKAASAGPPFSNCCHLASNLHPFSSRPERIQKQQTEGLVVQRHSK